MYILGPLNKQKLVKQGLTEEEIEKIIVSSEKNVLYGNVIYHIIYI